MAVTGQGGIHFVPHGGGPLPLMGDSGHAGIVETMQGLGPAIEGSSAVIVVTAHWEADTFRFCGAANPGMIFDYYGFPPEAYEYSYPAPGAPELARQASALLSGAGIDNGTDPVRGYDHGTFVPMMLVRPQADIPILQMSLLSSLDPASHISAGRALAPLLAQGVTLIGSGLSFHNLRALLRGEAIPDGADRAFDEWLNETLCDPDADGNARLAGWELAPGARACHPREEHLLPLHVCFGAADAVGRTARNIFRGDLMGYRTSGFSWLEQTA